MNSDLLFAVQQDWKIFPLLHHSNLATEQPLLHHATSDETQIEQWEHQYPECAWAVATGSESVAIALKFSLDVGLPSIREFGKRAFSLSTTLQVRGRDKVIAFLRWPTIGLSPWISRSLAPGVCLLEEGDYVRIPGPGVSVHYRYDYLDREATVQQPSEWLLDLIHANSNMDGPVPILAFRLSTGVARCVLLSFERRGERWLCDFFEASGTAKVRKTLSFASSSKVVSLAVRSGAFMKQHDRSRLYEGLEAGHGRIPLNLTSEQYQKLIAA